MDEAVWLIIAAGAAGLVAGGIIVFAMCQPILARADATNVRAIKAFGEIDGLQIALDAKRAESARYAAAIARITTNLASAKPEAGQPFYPHRLAAFREAVALVLDACREAA